MKIICHANNLAGLKVDRIKFGREKRGQKTFQSTTNFPTLITSINKMLENSAIEC